MRTRSSCLALLVGAALVAGCAGGSGSGGSGSGGPAPTVSSRSAAPAPTRPPKAPGEVLVPPDKLAAVPGIPAADVRRTVRNTAYLLLSQYTDPQVIDGTDPSGLLTALKTSEVADRVRKTPRDPELLAIRPVFPARVLRAGAPVAEVVRSGFTVSRHACDFSQFCTGSAPGLPVTGTVSGLDVHWSGALRYRLTRVDDGKPVEVAYSVEIDWLYLVRQYPDNPVFVSAAPELGTGRIVAAPVLASCTKKGYLVPPQNAPAPTAADYRPPRAAGNPGAPGPCPL